MVVICTRCYFKGPPPPQEADQASGSASASDDEMSDVELLRRE